MKGLHTIAYLLLFIGGLNWGLKGAFGWELGDNLLGGMDTGIARVIYVLVGLSAIYILATHKKDCKGCVKGGEMKQM